MFFKGVNSIRCLNQIVHIKKKIFVVMLFFIKIFATDFDLVEFINNDNNNVEVGVDVNEQHTEDMDYSFLNLYLNTDENLNCEDQISPSINEEDIINIIDDQPIDAYIDITMEEDEEDIINIVDDVTKIDAYIDITMEENEKDIKVNDQPIDAYIDITMEEDEEDIKVNDHTYTLNLGKIIRDSFECIDQTPMNYSEIILLEANQSKISKPQMESFQNEQFNTQEICTNANLPELQPPHEIISFPKTNPEIGSVIKKSFNRSIKTINGQIKYILDLSSKGYRSIEPLGYRVLHYINLDNNRFTIVPNEILFIEYLESLSMKNNFITFMPKNNLQSLERLYLDNNYLEDIMPIVSLSELHIRNNKIRNVENINRMENLIRLTIDDNKVSLENLKLPRLRVLTMASTDQKTLNFLTNCNELKILDCSSNKITEINLKMSKIFLLRANNNKISTFTADETIVKTLRLDFNELERFILDFKVFKSLENLFLDNNKIEDIKIANGDLSKLKKLNLSHNKISSIDFKEGCMYLKFLDLSYNCLTYKNCKFIIGITSLQYLDLQNNYIESLIAFESNCLLFLNISNNPIMTLYKGFYNLPNLAVLIMSDLKLDQEPYFNKRLKNLKTLDCSNNKYNRMLHVPNDMPILEYVNLSNCGLRKFPISIPRKHLKHIILSKNLLNYLPANFKDLRGKIEKLDLRENPLSLLPNRNYLGALSILEQFYGKVLLDESIIEAISALSFSEIESNKSKNLVISIIKEHEIETKFRFALDYFHTILENESTEIKDIIVEILSLIEEMRISGFLFFDYVMDGITSLIGSIEDKKMCVQRVILYLNRSFPKILYHFLKNIVYEYKIEAVRKAIKFIYNSEEHLYYWMYHLRDILSFTGIEGIMENSKIHKDKNIIIYSYLKNMDVNDLVQIIIIRLERDEVALQLYFEFLNCSKKNFVMKKPTNDDKKLSYHDNESIQYILTLFQMVKNK